MPRCLVCFAGLLNIRHKFGTHRRSMSRSRRRPVGAELVEGGVHFRVWAPVRKTVSVMLDDGNEHVLEAEGNGYFAGIVRNIGADTRYRFRLDGGEEAFPDPASRFQPDGPHGPSAVVDPRRHSWRDASWRGTQLRGAVIYETHIGTFTPEGTFRAAVQHLAHLAATGITVIELMPVNTFPGRFGWGYDGVDLWAPVHIYGEPYDFMAFVDAAHGHGLAVILDVVYNHLGPDGCYLSQFTPDYFTTKYENEWGEAVNFDGPNARGVREFIAHNAAHWIDEYHLDGLRIDATQSIFDGSRPHILREIAECARSAAAGRDILLIGENEPQDTGMIEQHGMDALWNDDWHHSAMVALTGKAEAYYSDHRGEPQEFISMAKLGFLYQGQWYGWQKKGRGTPSGHLSPDRLVIYLQNHDQLANSARGDRIHKIADADKVRAMTTLLLLSPQTPMLFQGQEFAASAPFLYFADHGGELAAKVRRGRLDFLAQFPSLAAMRDSLAAPEEARTFEVCKLDWSELDRHGEMLSLHRDLLRLRRDDPTFSRQSADSLHGAVIAGKAFALRWFAAGADRILVINLGEAFDIDPLAEPLLAPPHRGDWVSLFSSNALVYGGGGTMMSTATTWRIPANGAFVLGV